MKVIDIAKTIDKKNKIKFIGIRPGEKIHESMISKEDSFYTYEYKKYFKILPSFNNLYKDKNYIKNGKKVFANFEYNSKLNREWMNKNTLEKWIKKFLSSEDFGNI